ncbi:phage tail protein [Aeromonas hydrophila]|uniref:tail fiber assembly protein n=1 Tax=Aeromonas TaxID=642 RepID=UPI0011174303|nr:MULTISPECIES: tail fiber assembly protein [Aeromonas]TNH89859.1 phage tail protein [Aeromonas hydrophila]UAK72146.1 tail fiber assembly protein [Aeromonas enteropelogenes]
MEIEVITAANPRHLAGDQDSITLDVRFSHLEEVVEFTARRDDAERHGRELYSRAVFGEFGEIKVITPPPPTEAELLARLDEALKRAAAVMAPLEDADKLGIISEREKAQLTAWQRYRVALYRLPQSEGWPTDVTWPDAPQ